MQTDDIDDDFVLSDGPGYRAAMCSKCGAIKPIKDFQRRMSKAYAQGMGKAAGVGMVVESSMCKACQPKPKPVHKLTRKELHNKVQSGDVHAMVAEAVLEKRHTRARIKMREAVQSTWDKVRMAHWDALIDTTQKELRRVQQQEKYVKTNPKTCDEESLLTFFVEYKALLTASVARLKMRQRTHIKKDSPLPPHADWQGYIDPTDWQKVRTLWEATPFTYRTASKNPALLSVHPEDAAPYEPTNKTIRKGPTAAERLGLTQGEKK